MWIVSRIFVMISTLAQTPYFPSRPDVIVAPDDPFVAGQFTQAQRAARVQFLRADGDFRAQTQLGAVSETSRGIDVNRCRIHFVHEARGVGLVSRQDTIAVRRAVILYVRNSFVQSADN